MGESNETGAGGYAIKLALNGQFLIWKSWPETGTIIKMTDEGRDVLRRFVPDEEIERFVSMPHKGLDIQTIDPKTGERIAYCFDSQRVYGQGRARLEANKEIMEWELSGISRRLTGISIMEKISDNKFSNDMKYTMPNGSKMEEKIEMIRKKTKTRK